MILNAGLVAAFISSAFIPIVLPAVLVLIAGAVLWLSTGWSLLTNRLRLAERTAEWGQSRSLFIGAGSSSVAVNRLSGLAYLAGAGFMIFGAAWASVTFWRQLL